MKWRDLEQQLSKLGWWFSHHGGDHDRWTNGKESESIPRHREIKNILQKNSQESKRKFPIKGGINGIRR